MEPYFFLNLRKYNNVKTWLHRWSHVFIKIYLGKFVKDTTPSMELCFYSILSSQFFVKTWLHRWSYVFTEFYLGRFGKKHDSIDKLMCFTVFFLGRFGKKHGFIVSSKIKLNTVLVSKRNKTKSCFTNKTRSRIN